MTYEYVELTRQAATSHWGWTIAFFLWFVGLSGMSLLLNFWLRSRRILYWATGAAIVGTLLVVSHLARMLNLPFAAINALIEGTFNFTSWMFIGICILAVLCVVTVIESFLVWKASKAGTTCSVESCGWYGFNAVLGVAATAYSGFLLTQAAGVPLWTTAVLPVLWLFSGLASAMGLTEILAASGRLEGGHRQWFGTTANLIHVGEAFVLFAFLNVAFQGTPGAVVGAQNLVSGSEAGLFWGGVVIAGILAPIVLTMTKSKATTLLAGAAALAGALALRASVLFAGAFEPVIF